MTVETEQSSIVFNGIIDGVGCAIPFPIQQNSDLSVFYNADTIAVENTDYSVTLDAPDYLTATVTPLTGFAAKSGGTIAVQRIIPYLQELEIPTKATIASSRLEQLGDRLTFLAQQLRDKSARAVAYPAIDGAASIGPLPPAPTRANMFLGFDGAGKPIAVAGATSTGTPFSAFGQAFVAAPGAAAGRAALGVDLFNNVKSAPWSAKGDGVTNDTGALTSASATAIVIPAGQYVITSPITFSKHVWVLPGASFLNSALLTFNGGFTCDIQPVFMGSSTAAFSPAQTQVGFAEWWGAQPFNAAFNSAPAINLALTALRTVQLQLADYYTGSTTVKLPLGLKRLRGYGRNNTVSGSCTRLLSQSGSATIVQFGPDTLPAGGFANFPNEISLEDLQVSRTVAPIIASNCIGVSAQYNLYSEIRNVLSVDSIWTFRYTGTSNLKVRNSYGRRDTAGTGGGTDSYRGHFVDGTVNVGFLGGNASLYILGCGASGLGLGTMASGLYLNTAFTDLFVDWFETSGVAVPVQIEGDGNATYNADGNDCRINKLTADGALYAGIYAHNLSKHNTITVRGGYVAMAATGAAPSAVACIFLNSCLASLDLQGMQLFCDLHTGVNGIRAINSAGWESRCIIKESTMSPVYINGCTDYDVYDKITNFNTACASAAVLQEGTNSQFDLKPRVRGQAGAFAYGIYLQSNTSTKGEANVSRIDPGCITGGAVNKLLNNGVQIVAVGIFDTNKVASGQFL